MPSSSSRPTAGFPAVSAPETVEGDAKGKGKKGKGKGGKGAGRGKGKAKGDGTAVAGDEQLPKVKTAQQEAKQVACLDTACRL